METESEGHIPVLDLDFYRRSDGYLGYKVYRKPTHTDLYVSSKSHHHPTNKHAVLSTLVHRARALREWLQRPADPQSVQSPSAYRSTRQQAQLSLS
jgi:hypothetical protein